MPEQQGREVFCPACEDYRATGIVTRDENYTYGGLKITVPVTFEACLMCGENLNPAEQDDAVLDAIHAEYRRRMGGKNA